MAIITVGYNSTQATTANLTSKNFLPAATGGGQLAVFQGYYKNLEGSALAAGTVICMIKNLPPCTILGSSIVKTTALGTGRTLDIGLQEHIKYDGTTFTGDDDILATVIDVSAATDTTLRADATIPATGYAVTGQTDVLFSIKSGTIPTNAEFFLQLEVVIG